MLKILAGVGLLAAVLTMVDINVSPTARKDMLSAGRSIMGFVNRNSKVTDEYLRCMELNPKQPEVCKQKVVKDATEANPIRFEVRGIQVGVGEKGSQDGGSK